MRSTPFALPGGFFNVNKGLILAADNEAELAGVMSHEIAHVCARHAMENEAKMRALDYGLLAGMILGGVFVGLHVLIFFAYLALFGFGIAFGAFHK